MIKTDIQIRFSDLDMLGHVNQSRLQQYFDMGKVRYCIDILGMPNIWVDRALIVANINTAYLQEVLIENRVYVTTRISKLGTKSVTFVQELVDCDTNVVKSHNESVLVGFDLKSRKSVEVYDDWREKIIAHEPDLIVK